MPASNSTSWWQAQRKCGPAGLEGRESFYQCLSEELVKENNQKRQWGQAFFPEIKIPSAFNENARREIQKLNDEYIAKRFQADSRFQAQAEANFQEFKKNLFSSIRSVSWNQQNSMPSGWKNWGPEEFCSFTYAKSSSFVSYWGIEQGAVMEQVLQKCVELQQTKNKRFFIKDDVWLAWIDEVLK